MKRGAPKGNRNRSKDKLIEAALRRELTQNPEDALFIARACIKKAKDGDISAMHFIRDTVDGKPTEHFEVDKTTTVVHAERIQEIRDSLRRRQGASGRTVQ